MTIRSHTILNALGGSAGAINYRAVVAVINTTLAASSAAITWVLWGKQLQLD